MTRTKRRAVAAIVAAGALGGGAIAASGSSSDGLTSVPAPNPKQAGIVYPDKLSRELFETPVAQGAMKLENGTAQVPYYGYDGNGPMVPAAGSTAEAQKTEPDKNTYLTLRGQTGADPDYDYGTHFLYQGHEAGSPGYITRVNLDADVDHRVTLLATQDKNGQDLPAFDGSTWDPFAQRLLFTAEKGNEGGVWQATLGVPSTVEDVSGALGRGGYEGIQNDSAGNVYIVEDVGGKSGTQNPHAKQPNSFVYRFLPNRRNDLKQGGRLQALQVQRGGQPIVFHDGQADADIKSDAVKDLHTYGKTFVTRWVTIHDTSTDGSTPFDANAAAKAASATPFKRPENGVFKPGSGFRDFYFTETGDTNKDTEAGSQYGGFGGVFKLSQSPNSNAGTLSLFYLGDVAHTGLDNIAFWSKDGLSVVEDAGDSLHSQRNALDSGYLLRTNRDYSNGLEPLRFLAEGRDASATIDSGLSGSQGFTNDGDNEITGIHVSNGDPSPAGILGAATPEAFHDGWRVFWTQQHGDNFTWEILRGRAAESSSEAADERGRGDEHDKHDKHGKHDKHDKHDKHGSKRGRSRR